MNIPKSIFIATFFISIFCNDAFAQQKVVIIGLDGFSAEGYKAAKHPNIDKLVADGVLSLTTRPVMPSVTLP